MLNLSLRLTIYTFLHLHIFLLLFLVLKAKEIFELRELTLMLHHKLICIYHLSIEIHIGPITCITFYQGIVCSLSGSIGREQKYLVNVCESTE